MMSKQVLEPLQKMQARMDKLDDKFSFIDAATKAFECIVCRCVVNTPFIGSCCN